MSQRDERKQDIRKEIVTVGEDLFRRNGYDATSMTEIASKAGISRKTLFNYMGSKELILLGILDIFVGNNRDEWRETPDIKYGDARDLIPSCAPSQLKSMVENRWLMELAARYTRIYAEDLDHSSLHELREMHYVNHRYREIRIKSCQKMGYIRSDIDASDISSYYNASRDHVIRSWLLDTRSLPRDLTDSFNRCMSILIRGVTA